MTIQPVPLAAAVVGWHGFELSRTGRGTPTCSHGVLYASPPRYRTLAYGRVWQVDGIRCTSRVTGLTCTAGAHGLFISRASWRGG